MVNQDFRVEWIRQRVSAGFNLPERHYFDELLSREDGEEEEKILNFLNYNSQEDFSICLLFLKTLPEEGIGEGEGKCEVSKTAEPKVAWPFSPSTLFCTFGYSYLEWNPNLCFYIKLWCWISDRREDKDSGVDEEKTMSQGEGQVTSLQQFFLHVRSDLTQIVMLDVTQMALLLTKSSMIRFRNMKFNLFTLMSSTQL